MNTEEEIDRVNAETELYRAKIKLEEAKRELERLQGGGSLQPKIHDQTKGKGIATKLFDAVEYATRPRKRK